MLLTVECAPCQNVNCDSLSDVQYNLQSLTAPESTVTASTGECIPCQVIICENPPDIAYNLEALPRVPLTPVAPVTFGNLAVQYCCPEGETMTYSETLPSWLSINTETNCLVGASNSFFASSIITATAQAQAELDAFVSDALGSGALSCGESDCIPANFDPLAFSGTITNMDPVSTIVTGGGNHYTNTFTFSGVAGQTYQVWAQGATFYLEMIVSDPAMVIVDQQTTGGWRQTGNLFDGVQIYFTAGSTGTFTVEITTVTALVTGAWVAAVSTGSYQDISSANWKLPEFPVWIESTNRVFAITADAGPTFYITSINATTGGVVNDELIVGPLDTATWIVYNSSESAMWAFELMFPAANFTLARYNATTGVLLETFPAPSEMEAGVYVESTNEIWFLELDTGETDISIYDCASRTVTGTIPLTVAITLNDQGSRPLLYISEIDRIVFCGDKFLVINPNTRTVLVNTSGFSYSGYGRETYCAVDGFVYAIDQNNPPTIEAINVTTGITDHSFQGGDWDVPPLSIVFDPCLDCLHLLGDNFYVNIDSQNSYYSIDALFSRSGSFICAKVLEENNTGTAPNSPGFSQCWVASRSRMFVALPGSLAGTTPIHVVD